MTAPLIVGAGFSGLIAACMFPGASVVESSPAPTQGHKALLRFRSDVVANVTGVPFRPVTVRKGIFYNGKLCRANIRLANMYAHKVTGRVQERSVWDLEPVRRWVAPDNFHERLLEKVGSRISYATQWAPEPGQQARPVISTAPLDATLRAVGLEFAGDDAMFRHAPITVERHRIPGADVFQTIYFPAVWPSAGNGLALYRASITGDVLILEMMGDDLSDSQRACAFNEATLAFGLPQKLVERAEARPHRQRYGKISDFADDSLRKALLQKLTVERNVYSLGRFATWRNILLDDVVSDSLVIQRLMSANDYERKLIHVKEK